MAAEELLGRARPGAAAAVAPHHLDAHLAHDGLEDLVLVLEVVVEGAGGEIGAAHDVAHAGRAIADLGEHGARGLEQRRAVLRLVLLAPARALAAVVRAAVVMPACSVIRYAPTHRPSRASSCRSPATISSIARAAACNAPRMPTKPWISEFELAMDRLDPGRRQPLGIGLALVAQRVEARR